MSGLELFDVVDTDDRVIGSAPRAEVHAKGLLHRAVHVFVFRADGRLYLQRRSWSKDASPGQWTTSCSGHVDAGESYYSAALRELNEELGIVANESLQRLFALPPHAMTGNEFVWVFTLQTEAQVNADPLEIMDGRWLTPADLRLWMQREPDVFAASFHWLWPLAESALQSWRFQPPYLP